MALCAPIICVCTLHCSQLPPRTHLHLWVCVCVWRRRTKINACACYVNKCVVAHVFVFFNTHFVCDLRTIISLLEYVYFIHSCINQHLRYCFIIFYLINKLNAANFVCWVSVPVRPFPKVKVHQKMKILLSTKLFGYHWLLSNGWKMRHFSKYVSFYLLKNKESQVWNNVSVNNWFFGGLSL